MPSNEAIAAKRELVKEIVDPNKSLLAERAEWDSYAETVSVSPAVTLEAAEVSGVPSVWLRPRNTQGRATILYAHGGGLTAGSMLTHRSLASELAIATSCNVLLPDYRLLPENPPSAPSDDILNVYAQIIVDPTLAKAPVFLGGDSSGAGLALTATRRLMTCGLPPPMGCFALSGAFDATLSGASHWENENADPILSQAALRHWQTQLGDDVSLKDPLISPLFADLSQLPPTLLLAGEDEVWLDDTRRMHAALTSAGVPCEMRIYEGMWHVWPMTPGLPETQDAFLRIANFIAQNANAQN